MNNNSSHWPIMSLGEVCQINPPKSEVIDLPDDLEVTFLPMAAVSEDGVIVSPEKRKLSEVRNGFSYFREKDVLFAKITPCMENGKGAIASNLINSIGFGSTEFHVLRVKEQVCPDWIYFFLQRKDFREEAARHMTGTAGQKRVPKQFLQRIQVPVPPIEVQEKIVVMLHNASKLKQKREQANHLTSKIVQSVFLNMFGYPSSNPKGWNIEELTNGLIELIYRYPTFYGIEYIDHGVKVLKVENVSKDGYINRGLDSIRYITQETNEKFPKTILREGDLVMAVRGATIGKVAVVPPEFEGCNINPNLIRISTKRARLNSIYLWAYLNLPCGREQFALRVTNTAKATITVPNILRLKIPLPPINLQEKFGLIIKRVWRLRDTQQQSTQQTTQLRTSLMHKAFSGELRIGTQSAVHKFNAEEEDKPKEVHTLQDNVSD